MVIKIDPEAYEKQIVPLSIEREDYDIRLEPVAQYNNNLEFVVSMRCKIPLVITPQLFMAVKDFGRFVELESEMFLRNCLKTGVPTGVIKQEIRDVVKSRKNTCSAEWFDFARELEKRLGL